MQINVLNIRGDTSLMENIVSGGGSNTEERRIFQGFFFFKSPNHFISFVTKPGKGTHIMLIYGFFEATVCVLQLAAVVVIRSSGCMLAGSFKTFCGLSGSRSGGEI